MSTTGKLLRSLNGNKRALIGLLLGAVIAGAGAYLVLGRQVVTETDARAVNSELRHAIDRNTGAITDVTERLSAVEANQHHLQRGQERMENGQYETRRRIDAMMDHLKVPQPE